MRACDVSAGRLPGSVLRAAFVPHLPIGVGVFEIPGLD